MVTVSAGRQFRLPVLSAAAFALCISLSAQTSTPAVGQFGQVQSAPAQSGNSQPSSASKSSTSVAHSTNRLKKPRAGKVAASATVPEQPVAPPPPNWPANAQAEPAHVGWNGHDLSISATNSSLAQILRDVSNSTGIKVEGASNDQRVFGSYGPADPRDVLTKLLDGTGYNVLMIGDQGQGIPRQLVLTARTGHASSVPAANNQPAQADDDAPEEPEQPEQPAEQRRPFGGLPPAGPGGRTPQQMMQELQQRQQQLQQENQQPTTPPVTPPNN